ncbi:MAG: hypothetical protein FGM52_02435 [Mycobacterium sp.]|nr:hypothetical protein [Mycobacterium sp.]
MFVVSRGPALGAAVFVLGLSMAGPPAVASADGPADDATSAATGPSANSAPARTGRPSPVDTSTARSGTAVRATTDDETVPAPGAARGRSTSDTASGRRAVSKPRAAASSSADESPGRRAVGSSRSPDSIPAQPLPSVAVGGELRAQDSPPRSAAVRSAPMVEDRPAVAAAPAAALTVAPAAPARPAASAPSGGAPSGAAACRTCWGAEAQTFGQAITTVVTRLFNSTFDWLSTIPAGPFTNLLEGALVLIRRSLFLIPTGVKAVQQGTELTVKVNTGSVAYVRRDGTRIEVSGLPSFRQADQFDSASVKDVQVSNPGDAGCAGLVLESGSVAASLQTNQIDSIRFGPDAGFDGAIKAAVKGGSLSLRDAIRGQQGVDIDAPVVLKSNVEIDGGSCKTPDSTCDVTFRQTVDAARAGKQSLTVTALGTTSFSGAVGSQAALASLLTRGIAPLKIDQSADTKTVPLHYAPFFETDDKGDVKVEVKYGIDVAIGDNPSQRYEFDTGGNAFFAGYNPAFWKNVPLTTVADTVSYTSGNTLNFVVANAAVTIGSGAQRVSTDRPIQIGAALTGGNVKKKPPTTFIFTNPDAPPFDGFFGDFGASFGTFNLRKADQGFLASPLFQLPGNLSTGFLVQLGPIGTTSPQLTVGITDTLRDQFRYAVPVDAAPGDNTYPVSGYPVLELFGITPTYYADGADGLLPIGCGKDVTCPTPLQTVIDSGAPSTGLRVTQGTPYVVNADSKTGKGQLQPTADLIARFPTTAGRQPFEWKLTAGNTPSVDFVEYGGESAVTKAQNANTGLNLYNTHDVMFDVQRKIIWLRPNDGGAKVLAGAVTTTGDQTYRQNAQLAGTYRTSGGQFSVGGVAVLLDDTVVDAGRGDVSFYGAVNGAILPVGDQTLTVNSSGATTFARGVGQQVALEAFVTDPGGTTSVNAGVTTYGDQRFGDQVALSGTYNVTTNGTFYVAEDATLAGPVAIVNSATGNGITFAGRIDGSPTRGYSLSMFTDGGTIDLKADVGSSFPLGGLVIDQLPNKKGATTTFNAGGSINLDGGLGNAPAIGLAIGPNVKKDKGDADSVKVNLPEGGVIRGFTDSGAVIGSAYRTVSGRISGFVISNNGKNGIETSGTSGLTLSNNAIVGNTASGVLSVEDDTLTLSDNTVSGSGTDGIKLVRSKNAVIQRNEISNNTQSGIFVTEDSAKDPKDTRNSIADNQISGNGSNGVTVDANSVGNSILGNSIFANGPVVDGKPVKTEGISLRKGPAGTVPGNAGQPAPQSVEARASGILFTTLTVKGSVAAYPADTGYTGTYTLEVFLSPATDSPNVQGVKLLAAKTDVPVGEFEITIDGFSAQDLGSFVTVTATPTTAPFNTSPFSESVAITT